jgi:hypothetical protein
LPRALHSFWVWVWVGRPAGRSERARRRRAEELLLWLRELVQQAELSGVHYSQSFEHFDANRDGKIDDWELLAGARRVGCELSADEVWDVLEWGFGAQTGQLSYEDFFYVLAPPGADPVDPEDEARESRAMEAKDAAADADSRACTGSDRERGRDDGGAESKDGDARGGGGAKDGNGDGDDSRDFAAKRGPRSEDASEQGGSNEGGGGGGARSRSRGTGSGGGGGGPAVAESKPSSSSLSSGVGVQRSRPSRQGSREMSHDDDDDDDADADWLR